MEQNIKNTATSKLWPYAFLLAALLAFAPVTAFCQDFKFISLEYSNVVNPNNAIVKVRMYRMLDGAYSVRVESKSFFQKIDPVTHKLKAPTEPIVEERTITESQFQAVVQAVLKIRSTDILHGPHPYVLDGSTCSISYGASGAAVTYTANTPDYATDERRLRDFLDAFELILKTAALAPENFFGPSAGQK